MKAAEKQQRNSLVCMRLPFLNRLPGPAACVQLGLVVLVCFLAYRLQVVLLSNQQDKSTDIPDHPSPAIDDLISWVEDHNGIVNVEVQEAPGLGRFVVAADDIVAGDILAMVPKRLTLDVKARKSTMESMVKMWNELKKQDSPLAPYLKVLPSISQVFSYYSMPESYLPLIQNTAVVEFIKGMQEEFQRLLPNVRAAQSMNMSDAMYMMSLVTTRTFDAGDQGVLMVPVLDFANHHNHCPHKVIVARNCGAEAPEGCVVWQAGKDVPAGAEVCNSYEQFMLQDRALLQYGMLLEDAPAHMLSGIDRHDFNPKRPMVFHANSDLKPFEGTHEEIHAEVARLDKLLSDMQQLDSSNLQITPDPEVDPNGEVLHNLHQWRVQRKAAIAAERTRLMHLLQQAPSAAAGTAPSTPAEVVLLSNQQDKSTDIPDHPSPAIDDLISWVEDHNGIVNVDVREAPGLGRFVVAAVDIVAGDVLAMVPRNLTLDVKARKSSEESIVKMWNEFQKQDSPLTPYLKVLPSMSQVFSYYSMPESYLPLIQNTAVVENIKTKRKEFQRLLPHAAVDQPLNMSDAMYMMSLVTTRTFDAGEEGKLMVPVLDFANHHNHCPHKVIVAKDCGAMAPQGCVLWRAGEDVPAGAEVCNSYEQFMLQDRAMLLYGMLQRDAPAHMLSGIDRHDFNPKTPTAFHANVDKKPFEGTHEEIHAEVARLDKLLSDMQQLDSSNLQIAPDPEVDPNGEVLHNLHQWRVQRKAAIAAERTRLMHLLQQAPPASAPAEV